MLKKLITPFQQVLLQRQLCPGCVRDLNAQLERQARMNQTEQVVCECGRVFIFDKQLDIYRRALPQEARLNG